MSNRVGEQEKMSSTVTENILRFKVTKDNLKTFLSQAFLYNKGKATFEKGVTAEITPEAFTVKDLSLDVIGVYIKAGQRMFKEYDVPVSYRDKPLKVALMPSLYEAFVGRFENDETVSMEISDSYYKIQGKYDKIEDELQPPVERNFPVNIDLVDITDKEKIFAPIGDKDKKDVIVQIPISSLKGLPDTKIYPFESNGKDIKLSFDSTLRATQDHTGPKYTRTLQIDNKAKLDSLSIEMDANYINKVTNNVTDKVWLLMDKYNIVISKTTAELVSIFFIASNLIPDQASS